MIMSSFQDMFSKLFTGRPNRWPFFFLPKIYKIKGVAPIAQWIERRPPKLKIEVRFPVGVKYVCRFPARHA